MCCVTVRFDSFALRCHVLCCVVWLCVALCCAVWCCVVCFVAVMCCAELCDVVWCWCCDVKAVLCCAVESCVELHGVVLWFVFTCLLLVYSFSCDVWCCGVL